MIFWSDVGIVLSSKKHCEKYKIVDVFTKKHGKISGMVSISRCNKLSIFSNVEVDYSSKNEGSLGFWKTKDEKQNWIYALNSEAHTLICQSICFTLNKILPHGVCHENLFDFSQYISNNLHKFSKIEALNLYAYFEFLLLDCSGFGLDLDTCCICGKREDVHYISPKTCHGASCECASKFDTSKLFEVPESWRNWKNGDIKYSKSQDDIKKSLSITGTFIEKNLSQVPNFFRSHVVNLIYTHLT